MPARDLAPLAITARLRIDFPCGASLGPGKVALLEQILESGSLSAAARALGLSYRRAWLLLDDLNHGFGALVATTAKGGSGGGGARLTDLGRRLIEQYRAVEVAAAAEAGRRFRALPAKVRAAAAPSAALRRPISRSTGKSPRRVRS